MFVEDLRIACLIYWEKNEVAFRDTFNLENYNTNTQVKS